VSLLLPHQRAHRAARGDDLHRTKSHCSGRHAGRRVSLVARRHSQPAVLGPPHAHLPRDGAQLLRAGPRRPAVGNRRGGRRVALRCRAPHGRDELEGAWRASLAVDRRRRARHLVRHPSTSWRASAQPVVPQRLHGRGQLRPLAALRDVRAPPVVLVPPLEGHPGDHRRRQGRRGGRHARTCRCGGHVRHLGSVQGWAAQSGRAPEPNSRLPHRVPPALCPRR